VGAGSIKRGKRGSAQVQRDKKNKGEKEIHVHQVDGEVGKPCWLLISGCLKVR